MNRKMEYALMILHHFWEEQQKQEGPKQRPVSVKLIGERFGIPFDTASKVMQSLAQFGFLRAKQGVKGGYELQAELQQWNLNDVAQAVDENRALVECIHGECSLERDCPVYSPLKGLHHYLYSVLDNIRLGDLFDKNYPHLERKKGA